MAIFILILPLLFCASYKNFSSQNIKFPFLLSDKYLRGGSPYNPFEGKFNYLYRSYSVNKKYASKRGKCIAPSSRNYLMSRNILDYHIIKELCLPSFKEFSIWDKIGSSHFLLCYDRSEKISKDECMCVVYWELKDPKGFKETLRKVSSCPEKVDELIVDIDSE